MGVMDGAAIMETKWDRTAREDEDDEDEGLGDVQYS
jgi:hypothetical protein